MQERNVSGNGNENSPFYIPSSLKSQHFNSKFMSLYIGKTNLLWIRVWDLSRLSTVVFSFPPISWMQVLTQPISTQHSVTSITTFLDEFSAVLCPFSLRTDKSASFSYRNTEVYQTAKASNYCYVGMEGGKNNPKTKQQENLTDLVSLYKALLVMSTGKKRLC